MVIEENKGPSTRRLLEVDFFRGAAILVIFWNHLLLLTQTAGYLVRSPFRIHYGYSDSAAVFVFLSGFVSGIVYNKHLTGYGYLHTQMKALRRSGQIYGAQLVTLGVLVTCAFLWQDRGSLDPLRHQLQDFAVRPISEGLGLISLQSCLDYVDILPFYIVILAFVPLVLVGFRKFPVLTLLLSAFTLCCDTGVQSPELCPLDARLVCESVRMAVSFHPWTLSGISQTDQHAHDTPEENPGSVCFSGGHILVHQNTVAAVDASAKHPVGFRSDRQS